MIDQTKKSGFSGMPVMVVTVVGTIFATRAWFFPRSFTSVPTAWMSGLKNIDLVEQFGADDGFWKAFSAGV